MADVPEWLRGLTRTFFYSQIGKLKEKGLQVVMPGTIPGVLTYAIGVLTNTETFIFLFNMVVVSLLKKL